MLDAVFWAVHSGLSREGPGDEASLRRALAAMSDLPPDADILDVGCGPGAQTLVLADLTSGAITAVDTHQPFLDTLAASAAEHGWADRVTTLNASMAQLPFDDQGFDAIWSEGAIYFMGFRAGLDAWKRLLRPGGYIAVSEPCWLSPPAAVPQGARDFWDEYPAIGEVGAILASVAEAGYAVVDYFVLPPSAWWNYYEPMQARIDALREAWRADPIRLERLAQHQGQIDDYRRFGRWFSYLFVVMQAP